MARFPSLVRHLSIWNTPLAWFQSPEQLTTERRVAISTYTAYRFDDFLVDPSAWRLYRSDQEVHLEPTVLKLLVYLISNCDRLVTRDELMETVWGDTVISESALSKAVARLRKALDDEATLPKYVETVHSKGYRFVAEVEEIELPDSPTNKGKDSQKPLQGRRFLVLALLGLLTVLLVIFWPGSRQSGHPPLDKIESLAVLPLVNLTGDPGQEFLVDGLHDVLISELSQVGGLRVTSRQSMLRYKRSELPIAAIADELGVDVIIEGSIYQVADQTELGLQVIDARSDEHLWADRFKQDTSRVFDLLADVAATINAELLPSQSDETFAPPPSRHKGTIDQEASIAYLRGLGNINRLTKEALDRAIGQFKYAIEIEPLFAEAWSSLAVAQVTMVLAGYAPPDPTLKESRFSALKAVETDDQHYQGHAILGLLLWFTRDYTTACNAFEKALRLNPSDPYALHGKADCLMLAGQINESVELAHKTQLLDPFSSWAGRPLPYHLFIARRYDEAVLATLDLKDRIPAHPVHDLLAFIYWQQGDWDKALDEMGLKFEWQKDTVLLEALETARATAGPHETMRVLAKAMVEHSDSKYIDPFRIAEAFALAGDVDEAITWLGKAIDQGSIETTHITVRPDFDLLRDDPRYPELLKRLGLKAAETDGYLPH